MCAYWYYLWISLIAEYMHQPDKVANPDRGHFPCPRSRLHENLVSRDKFGRPVPRQPVRSLHLD